MAEHEDFGLLAIEVDADDYAETAAGDAPSVPRTYQSEADFQAIKATYLAKIDGDPSRSTYEELVKSVPVLNGNRGGSESDGTNGQTEKVKLGKKDVQLLGYAVGELYFDRRYDEVVKLCERIKERCVVGAKMEQSLERWMGRCRERMG